MNTDPPAATINEFRQSFGRYAMLFAASLAALGAAEVALYAAGRNTRASVDHAREVVRLTQRSAALALVREAGVREFLVTRDPAPLQRERDARAALGPALDSLAALVADNEAEQHRARAITLALAAWDSAFARPSIEGAAPASPARLAGRDLFESVRARFAEFEIAEEALYDSRRSFDRLVANVALAALFFPLIVLAGLFVALGSRIRAQAAQLADQQHHLESQAVELETQVEALEAGNAELSRTVNAEIVARERAEEATREQERTSALLDSALESLPIGMTFLDRELRYLRVNPQASTLIGRPETELLGRTLREANPNLDPQYEAQIRQVIESGVPIVDVPMTREMGSVPGQVRQLVLSFYPLRTTSGEILGAGVAIVDVTDRSILQEQFHQSQKLEAVGRLAAGVAHDFNNLLTVIRSYCDVILLEISPEAPWRDELQEIRSAADRAGELAKQMLGAGRHLSVLPRLLEFSEVIAGLEPLLRRATTAEVQLVLRVSPELAIVRFDPSQIEQVLLNLVINASDAMPRGGEILVETRNVSVDAAFVARHPGAREGAHVMLRVTDTGDGMDEETRRRAFEPFFTTKSRDRGTGLGLATVYGIVKQMGGVIDLESEVGKGTAFSIYLPRDVAEEATGPRRARAARERNTPRGSETVLLADDDVALLASITRSLERLGYIVLAASHGGEAVRVATEHKGRIHLLMTDVNMPGMSGSELARRITAIRPGTRVLYMSGSPATGEVATAETRNGTGFLAKPFSFEELSRGVREALEGK